MRTRPYVLRADWPRVWAEGPLNQPCDLRGEPDADGFVEFMNDIYEKGYRAGFEDRGNPDLYKEIIKGSNLR
jgi:hypothetical protein